MSASTLFLVTDLSPAQVRRIRDPLERARVARREADRHRQLVAAYRPITGEAVRELQAQGWSLARIAAALNLSKAGVEKLSKE